MTDPWYHPNTVKRLTEPELSRLICRAKDELELLEERTDPRAVEQRKQLQAQLETLTEEHDARIRRIDAGNDDLNDVELFPLP